MGLFVLSIPPRRVAIFLTFAAALLGMTACGQLPKLDGRTASSALPVTAETRLARAIAPAVAKRPGKTGVYPLWSGRDAFAARALLFDAAERTIDIQYYIWRADMSGSLLFSKLLAAAERGVRVRLLLDDHNTTGLDPLLAKLDAHENIEVRLFNPFVSRRLRGLNFVTDFSRLNRRMHNKSLIVDNQVIIVGGRNVGDEYFGASNDFLFVDLDLMAIGAVVDEVSRDFDQYWASESAYPAAQLITVPPARGKLAPVTSTTTAIDFVEAIRSSDFVAKLLARNLPLEWGRAKLVSDHPAKGLGQAPDAAFFPRILGERLGRPTRELLIVSPYFVPAGRSFEFLRGLAKSGVNVKVLTNSLEATDVSIVHSYYAKYRKQLIKAGVKVFELKRLTSRPVLRRPGSSGSSSTSLHAKTFVVDRSRVFVGSFNFDPRSARLNTEMGLIVESEALAHALAAALATRVPDNAYEVSLSGDGTLRWLERTGTGEAVHHAEPASWGRRAGTAFWSLLPIEWLL